MTSVMLGDVLTTPPPVGAVPPQTPLVSVPVKVDEEIDLVDLVILSLVALGSCSQLLILIRITSKIISLGTSCSNLPWWFLSLVHRKRVVLPWSQWETYS